MDAFTLWWMEDIDFGSALARERWLASGRAIPDATRRLADIIVTHGEDQRSDAVLVVGLLGDRTAVPVLLRLLEEADEVLLARILEALGRLGERSVETRLDAYARDVGANISVRGVSCIELGRLRSPSAATTLDWVESAENTTTRNPFPAHPAGGTPPGAVVETFGTPTDTDKEYLLGCVRRGRELLSAP